MERAARPGAEIGPAELKDLPRGEIGCERLDDLAAGERELHRRPEAGHLGRRRLDHLLLAGRASKVRLGWVEPILADPRQDQRAATVHVLLALRKVPARPSPALRWRRIRAVELVGEDRLLHRDVDAADGVDQLLEVGEIDERNVIDVEPCEILHRAQRQRRAAELERGVDLVRAVAGNLDAQVARDREVREPMSARVGADEHDRVGVARAGTAGLATIGAEHEERRRSRREQSALFRELLPHA